MIETQAHSQVYVANPTINVTPSRRGYVISDTPSQTLGARLGSLLFLVFCLVFLGAGIAVWFLPDTAFDGDPLMLKGIVTGATWLIFGPIVYFNFISQTTQITEVDLNARKLHQVFLGKNGQETKRRSFDFAEIQALELLTNRPHVSTDLRDMVEQYGQIHLRLDRRKGTSLVWGPLQDLRPVWDLMRHDIGAQPA